jgi:hypothetical protein
MSNNFREIFLCPPCDHTSLAKILQKTANKRLSKTSLASLRKSGGFSREVLSPLFYSHLQNQPFYTLQKIPQPLHRRSKSRLRISKGPAQNKHELTHSVARRISSRPSHAHPINAPVNPVGPVILSQNPFEDSNKPAPQNPPRRNFLKTALLPRHHALGYDCPLFK